MKAFVFDRDGVIIDSEHANIEAVRGALKTINITMDNEDAQWIVGKHPADYLIPISKKYNFVPDEKFNEIHHKIYKKLLEEVPLIQDTVTLIKKLHAKNIPLALCTSSSLGYTEFVLEKAGIKEYFKAIITFESYTHRKPHPEPYLTAAKKLGIDPKECIAVEDSVYGLESAKAAGMKCIILENKYMKSHFKPEEFSKADLIVKSALDIDVEEVMK
jgi:HAD superfamily hydrolase (TIGR01509 family)